MTKKAHEFCRSIIDLIDRYLTQDPKGLRTLLCALSAAVTGPMTTAGLGLGLGPGPGSGLGLGLGSGSGQVAGIGADLIVCSGKSATEERE